MFDIPADYFKDSLEGGGNSEVPVANAPLLAQAQPQIIPNTPSKYAAELQARLKFDVNNCPAETSGACCNPLGNHRH